MARKKKKKAKHWKGLSPVSKVGYAGVAVHGTGVYDQLKYTVLTASKMNELDKEKVLSILKTITTGPEVMNLPTATNGWNCLKLDMFGKAILVSYHGVEVALFYKRQLTEIKLLPGDRFPEGVLRDPNDAWQRLDLLGKSAKQANVVLTNLHERLEEEHKVLKARIQTLEVINGTLETANNKLEEVMTFFTLNEKRMASKRRKTDIKKADKSYKIELARKKARIARELAKKKKRRKRKKVKK